MRVARATGFTLLELLLALTVLAAAMTLAFQTLRIATASIAGGERLAASTDEIRTAQRLLRRQIGAARPLVFERAGTVGTPTMFEGRADGLRFAAPMPGHLSRGGPYLQILQLVPGVDGYRLEFDYRMLAGETAVEERDPRPPTVLLDGIATARLGYLAHRGGDAPQWQSHWATPQQLPALVRLEVEFVDPRREWPHFELALPLALPMWPSGMPVLLPLPVRG